MRFGPFVLDTTRMVLTRGRKPVELPTRGVQLVHFLLTHQDRALTRDELMDALWPGRIVTDNTLSQLVSHVRQALGDSANQPRYIRTVHGVGLQWVGEVREARRPVPRSAVLALVAVVAVAATLIGVRMVGPDAAPRAGAAFVEAASAPGWLNGLAGYVQQVFSTSGTGALPLADGSVQENEFDSSGELFSALDTRYGMATHVLFALDTSDEVLRLTIELRRAGNAVETHTLSGGTTDELATQAFLWISDRFALADSQLFDPYIAQCHVSAMDAFVQHDNALAEGRLMECLRRAPDFLPSRLALAQVLFRLSRFEEALSQANAVALAASTRPLQAQAELLAGKCLRRLTQWEKMLTILSPLTADSEASPVVRLEAASELVIYYADQEQIQLARDVAHAAIDEGARAGLSLPTAKLNEALGDTEFGAGNLGAAKTAYNDAMRAYETAQSLRGVASILAGLGILAQYESDLTAALGYARRRSAIATRLQDPTVIAGAALDLARIMIDMGDVEEARGHVDTLYAHAFAVEDPEAQVLAVYMKAQLAEAAGELDEAQSYYRQGLQMAVANEQPSRELLIGYSLGEVLVHMDRSADALDVFEKVHQRAVALGAPMWQAAAHLGRGKAYSKAGNAPQALAALSEASEMATIIDHPQMDFEVTMAWAEHELQHDPHAAAEHLSGVPEAYHDDWLYLYLRAKAQALTGNTEAAMADVARARSIAGERWLPTHTLALEDAGVVID